MLHFQSLYNIMLATDSYKISHANMLPEDLEYMETYAESRGGDFQYNLMFGMNYQIKSYLVGRQVTEEKIQEAKALYSVHFGSDAVFLEDKWRYILENHDGYLPIRIRSVKEGSIVPVKNVLFKVESTDPKCAWLVGIVETMLMRLWYPISVATNSMAGMEILKYHYDKTGVTSDLRFALHDFGYRGVSCEEQAWIGGAAHLLTFKGTDTVAGIRMLQHYYGASVEGFSVPATEHMVMTIKGRAGERQRYIDVLKAYPDGIVSIVSDTYNIYEVCEMLGTDEEIRQLILNRNGKLVIRPDSGEPVEVLIKCLDIIEKHFGSTVNEKGYKTIYEKIGFIWGDGISITSVHTILENMTRANWSIDNFVFGGGKEILQNFTRDTIKFAIKCSFAIINGQSIDVYKDPITGSGKKSKIGQQFLTYDEETGYKTVSSIDIKEDSSLSYLKDALEIVYENGNLLVDPTYNEIIEHYQNQLKRIQQ